jgi:hypothetical protein
MVTEGSGPGVGHSEAAGQGEVVHVGEDDAHQLHWQLPNAFCFLCGGALAWGVCLRGGVHRAGALVAWRRQTTLLGGVRSSTLALA